jgi:hypothetical protein
LSRIRSLQRRAAFMMLCERRRRIRRANTDGRRKAHEFSRAHFAAEMDLHSTREMSIGSRYIRRAAAAQPSGECEEAAFLSDSNDKTRSMQSRQGCAGQDLRSSPLQAHAPLETWAATLGSTWRVGLAVEKVLPPT